MDTSLTILIQKFVHLEKELTSQTKYPPPPHKKKKLKENYHYVFPITDV